MSRIGKKPIPVPQEVEVSIAHGQVRVKGPKGELSLNHHPAMLVAFDAQQREIRVSRPNDSRTNRALHGLTRSLIANMVQGVVKPYEKVLEVHGVGYGASLAGDKISLSVGFKHPVELPIPKGIECEVKGNEITVRGIDKQMVGQFAASIRAVRPPEPYKGKGIRYKGEHVRRKAGKAFAK
ncbi:MAG: 50S ribosomal protein L6 [Planctomycetota bacterium]|nr:MAG: 50S ribosomal protein L6 [Planctomycetota bacterium]